MILKIDSLQMFSPSIVQNLWTYNYRPDNFLKASIHFSLILVKMMASTSKDA